MKILHVTSDYKPGGIQKAFEAYLAALSPLPQFKNFYFIPGGPQLKYHKYHAQHINMSWTQKSLLRRADFLPVQKLRNHKFKIGLVHNGFICAGINRYCDNIIGICHNDKPEQFKDADHLICLTPNAAKKALDFGRREYSIHLLPHYFEPKRKFQGKIKQNDALTIGAAGRFVEKKGFKTFIKAAAEIRYVYPEIKFLLAGDGPLSRQLRSYSESKGNPVKFIGWVDIDDFAPSIDIFCLPSLDEPYGYVLAEMMHYGVAIVSSRTNGPLWICKDESNALFFQPSDSSELANCLKTFISDTKMRIQYQQNAIQTINDKRFSKHAFSEHLLTIISKITENGKMF